MTTRTSQSLWHPPDETLETISEAIASHWNAAAKAYREKLFWPDAASWLPDATSWLSPVYHFTRGGKLIR